MKTFAKVLLALNLILLLSAGITVFADEIDTKNELPIGLTAEELTRLHEIGIDHVTTLPPDPGDIRCPAEWEPSEGVIIRYPLGLSYSVIAEMSEDLIVYCLVSSSYYSSANSNFTSQGVNMANVQFIITNTDSYWTRDYGPWFIFSGPGEFGVVDHIYNRPRPNDDAVPSVIGNLWSIPIYGMNLKTAGGNHMSNGCGTSISTDLIYTENPGLSQYKVDSIINAYLGNDYVVVDDALGEYIEHIDCWGKFLAPEIIMILELATSNPQHDELDDAADYFASLTGPYGRPYTVVRVYSPGGNAAYTNSTILNKKVFVPISGSAYYDNLALAAYQAAMPGYEVLGFTGSWENTDALHCRTMGVPDRGMLYISHIPQFISGDNQNDYEIKARIVDNSETGLFDDSLKIFYSIDDGASYDFAMMSMFAAPDSFAGYIPVQPYGTTVKYYLQAGDNSGRVESHPYIGAPMAHELYINMPPQISSDDSLVCEVKHLFAFQPAIFDEDNTEWSIVYENYPGWMQVLNDTLRGTAPPDVQTVYFDAAVSDPYVTTTQNVKLLLYLCGDVNLDNEVNILDIVEIIDFKFRNGQAPAIYQSADVNSTGTIDVLDIVALVNNKFKGGPTPDCP